MPESVSKEDLEYKLGRIDEAYDPAKPAKFIVYAEDEKTLALYAVRDRPHVRPKHYDIVYGFNLKKDKVCGGGSYRLQGETLRFYDWSLQFGSVPAEAAGRFAEIVAEFLREKGRTVTEIDIDMAPKFPNGKNRAKWRELGFDLPDDQEEEKKK